MWPPKPSWVLHSHTHSVLPPVGRAVRRVVCVGTHVPTCVGRAHFLLCWCSQDQHRELGLARGGGSVLAWRGVGHSMCSEQMRRRKARWVHGGAKGWMAQERSQHRVFHESFKTLSPVRVGARLLRPLLCPWGLRRVTRGRELTDVRWRQV